jgi:hypothetical protein
MRRWAALVIIWGLGAVSGSMVGWTSALFTSTTTNPGNSFAAASSFCPTASSQTVVTDRDGYVREDQTGNNFGAENELHVYSDSNKDRRSLLYFPLPAKPAGCVVSSAILRLYAIRVSPGRTIGAYRLAATPSWTETGVTWSSQPATAGSAATNSSGSTIGWKEWNVTSQVDLMYSGNNGFMVRDQSESAGSLQDQEYQSREGGSNDPELVVSFGSVACSSPGSQTVTASIDSYVKQDDPTGNFGIAPDIFVQSRATALNRRLLVKFTLPSQPANCSVSMAVLRLFATATAPGRTIQVFRAAASWTETGVTWNNQPATDGVASTYSPTANGWHEATVTARVQELYPGTDNGFILRDQTEDSGGTQDQKYDSRENTNDPELRITFG